MTICDHCNKQLSSKQALQRHQNVCKKIKENKFQNTQEKYEKEIQSLKEKNNELEEKIQSLEQQNKELQSQIYEIAKQPKNITNNNQKINIINQLAVYDLTEESVRSIVDEHFTDEVFNGGIEKIKKLVVDKILMDSDSKKPKIVMTDASRLNAKYLTDSGEIKTDVGCEKTYNLLKNPLLRKNVNTYSSLLDTHEDRTDHNKIYDRFSRNEQSINNKNQFVKTTILNV
jgi:hypothetical protein